MTAKHKGFKSGMGRFTNVYNNTCMCTGMTHILEAQWTQIIVKVKNVCLTIAQMSTSPKQNQPVQKYRAQVST